MKKKKKSGGGEAMPELLKIKSVFSYNNKSIGKINSALFKIRQSIIKFFLPWTASVITFFPYNDRSSRFLDRLVVLSEAG